MQQCRSASHLSVRMLNLVSVLTVATHLLAGKFVSHIDYWDAVSVLDVYSTLCCCQLNGGHSMGGGVCILGLTHKQTQHRRQISGG